MTASLDEAQALGLLDDAWADIKKYLVAIGANREEIAECDDLLHEADQMRKRRLENDALSPPYAIHNLNGYPAVIGFAASLTLLASAGRWLRRGPELAEGSEPRDDRS